VVCLLVTAVCIAKRLNRSICSVGSGLGGLRNHELDSDSGPHAERGTLKITATRLLPEFRFCFFSAGCYYATVYDEIIVFS